MATQFSNIKMVCYLFDDSCEVIRDQKSGESLQYAFIEFENVSRSFNNLQFSKLKVGQLLVNLK